MFQITQYGITWIFDKEYQCGKYANSDYWVIGPVTITNITPTFYSINNGWQVNPIPIATQGFDIGAQNFDPDLVPNLPYTANPGESIVKIISKYPGSSDCYPCCIKTATVLTVVDSPPPNNGASVFRPPYVSTAKPYYSICDLKTENLPSLTSVADASTLDWIVERFKCVQLHHGLRRTGRIIRP